MGERPEGMTLDRYPDPNGNYEPGNCRWATPKQQSSTVRKDLQTGRPRAYRFLPPGVHLLKLTEKEIKAQRAWCKRNGYTFKKRVKPGGLVEVTIEWDMSD